MHANFNFKNIDFEHKIYVGPGVNTGNPIE